MPVSEHIERSKETALKVLRAEGGDGQSKSLHVLNLLMVVKGESEARRVKSDPVSEIVIQLLKTLLEKKEFHNIGLLLGTLMANSLLSDKANEQCLLYSQEQFILNVVSAIEKKQSAVFERRMQDLSGLCQVNPEEAANLMRRMLESQTLKEHRGLLTCLQRLCQENPSVDLDKCSAKAFTFPGNMPLRFSAKHSKAVLAGEAKPNMKYVQLLKHQK